MGLISNGTTIFDAGALDSGLAKGAMTFIKKLTASSSATLSFVNGADGVVLDDTYKEYMFTFKDIHPQTDSVDFEFQADVGTGTSYAQTITSTAFRATAAEGDASDVALGYRASEDQADGTAFQDLNIGMGNDADQSLNGTLQIFNPASATFVKHFIARIQSPKSNDYHVDMFIAGYFNTTTALTRVQFKMSSGNIDAGDICLYGIA
jgi:hypothetical protein